MLGETCWYGWAELADVNLCTANLRGRHLVPSENLMATASRWCSSIIPRSNWAMLPSQRTHLLLRHCDFTQRANPKLCKTIGDWAALRPAFQDVVDKKVADAVALGVVELEELDRSF